MTTTSIAPLRKRNTESVLYVRLPETEAKLLDLNALSRDALAARCQIQDREHKDYVPSECLVTLVREHRSKSLDACGEALFKALLERLLRGLPKAETRRGENEDLTKGNVRDEAKFRFLEMLSRDQQEYVDSLDYYEVRFASALQALRVDAERKVYRRQDSLEPLETDDETGEFSPKIAKAMANLDPFDSRKLEDFDYRSHLDAAIDDLPAFQKAIVEMIRKGIPIESKEAGNITISTVLQKTPKTIATHRDKAYAILRAKLTKGEPV